SSSTLSSSYSSLIEAATKGSLKLQSGGDKCNSPLLPSIGQTASTQTSSASQQHKQSSKPASKTGLSQLPLSPVSPLSPFFQSQLLARNLSGLPSQSSPNGSTNAATGA